MPQLICTIPARAGSVRLPGKNLADLNGRPMIAYTIEVALSSRFFEEVYVCTESRTIADVAVAHGASVPFLVPEALCGELVASHVPCQHVADRLGAATDEILVVLQPTSPLRSVDDLERSVRRFLDENLNFLVSVTPIDPHYFHWAVQPGEDGQWEMYFGDRYMKERPLLPPVYRPNGSVKIARCEALREEGHFFGDRLGTIEVPEERAVHVATAFDLAVCELLLAQRGEV